MLMKHFHGWAVGGTKQQSLPGCVSKDNWLGGGRSPRELYGRYSGGSMSMWLFRGTASLQTSVGGGKNLFGHSSLIGWVLISTLPATSCMAQNKPVNLSKPRVSYIHDRNNYKLSLTGQLWKWNEIMATCSMFSKVPQKIVNTSYDDGSDSDIDYY